MAHVAAWREICQRQCQQIFLRGNKLFCSLRPSHSRGLRGLLVFGPAACFWMIQNLGQTLNQLPYGAARVGRVGPKQAATLGTISRDPLPFSKCSLCSLHFVRTVRQGCWSTISSCNSELTQFRQKETKISSMVHQPPFHLRCKVCEGLTLAVLRSINVASSPFRPPRINAHGRVRAAQ